MWLDLLRLVAARRTNSRFLHSAVPFGFAQGPTPVGMTRL
jgi:hypothetical protein